MPNPVKLPIPSNPLSKYFPSEVRRLDQLNCSQQKASVLHCKLTFAAYLLSEPETTSPGSMEPYLSFIHSKLAKNDRSILNRIRVIKSDTENHYHSIIISVPHSDFNRLISAIDSQLIRLDFQWDSFGVAGRIAKAKESLEKYGTAKFKTEVLSRPTSILRKLNQTK